MPLQQTSGNDTADAYGGGVAVVPNYIEDVFSTWLYSGTGATQTITNGIDLSGKGGLTWIKARTQPSFASNHTLFDTVRGTGKQIYSDATLAQATDNTSLTAFNGTGFTLGSDSTGTVNWSGHTFVSWTFRKQPKFFDVVSINSSTTTYNHNLGSTPGCIMVKCTDAGGANWVVYHRSLPTPTAQYLNLNTTVAAQTYAAGTWSTSSTQFSVDPTVWANGTTGIAYLFAHNAGGFGLTGTDNVISCGSYNRTDGVKSVVNLGFEPQFIIQKTATAGSQWTMLDVMRGWTGASNSNLFANLSNAETTGNIGIMPTATGFEDYTTAGATDTIIYIAIRRGPMKVPTDGTKVFIPIFPSASTGTQMTTGFPVDMQLLTYTPGGYGPYAIDRLRGVVTTPTNASSPFLKTNSTAMEVSNDFITRYWNNTGFEGSSFFGGSSTVFHNFRRAPSFFDEVCYTGTGSATTFTHNLGAVPELMIVKERNGANGWQVYSAALTNTDYLILNTTAGTASSATRWNSTTPTSTVFSVGTHGATNGSGQNFVNYLFATCAGVSKVGSYTGNGTTQTINCGFTGGARFVLIKRTDASGDWYVYDTARGMTTLTDPYLLLNSTAAESATLGSVTTVTTGFAVNASILAAINTNGASYIFLAIA